MNTLILGVDPGLGGALALYNPTHPHLSRLWDMPLNHDGQLDAPALDNIVGGDVCRHGLIKAVIERVSSMPRQAGAFNFGLSTGIVHGVLASRGIPFELVHPSVWKRGMGLTRTSEELQGENKSRARALAAQLFPTLADQFKRVRDDGRAEALLLAVFYANRGEK